MSVFGSKSDQHVCFLTDLIQARARYPTIVAGDLNARHRDWCTKTNRSGRKFKAWPSLYRFSVTAPRDPTFVSKQGRSTIDIYVSRGITVTTPNSVSSRGPWGGASDHIPVITVTSTKTCTTPHSRLPPHISTRLLSSIVHREKAENLYEEVIPQLIWKLRNPLKNLRGYTSNSTKLCCIHGEVPTQTEHQNSTRTGMRGWKRLRWKEIKSLESWKSPDKIAWNYGQRFMLWTNRSREVFATKKKSIRRQELNAMVQKPVPETQKWVKKYLRRSNTATMQSLQRVSPLDLASFTRRMETKRDNIARIPTRNFIVPLHFCSYIQRSISNLSNGSAAGQDMMHYEMFKIGADTLAQFLMAL